MRITHHGDEITVVVETAEERDALIAGLDNDRNHPTRSQLYDELRTIRAALAARVDPAEQPATNMQWPTGRPGFLGEFQPWGCARCGKDVDGSEKHDCQPEEYNAGREAGYAWLAGDGRAYLDPDDDSELVYPTGTALFDQGFSDAIKTVSWHFQNPGKVCINGPSCPDLAFLADLAATPATDGEAGVTFTEPQALLERVSDLSEGQLDGEQRVLTDITVELATFLLGRYVPTRPLAILVVMSIEQQIVNPDVEGESFEEVRISRTGKTIAGQHLLNAVLRCGQPARNVTVVLGAPTLVERYAQDMADSEFLFSGDETAAPTAPIRNGQHRLLALLDGIEQPCEQTQEHGEHEHYGTPASIRRECPGCTCTGAYPDAACPSHGIVMLIRSGSLNPDTPAEGEDR